MRRPRIEISESDVHPLHFIDIYLPKDDDDPPEVVMIHDENYLHIFLASSTGKPEIVVRGTPAFWQTFEEGAFSKWNFVDFQELNEKSEFTPNHERR